MKFVLSCTESRVGVASMLGTKVRQLRKAKGLTQEALAKVVGVEPSYIGHIERGRTKSPGRDVLVRLAEALGVPVEELLAAAGYLQAPRLDGLPDFHVYVSRKFAQTPRFRRALIQVYEQLQIIKEEEERRAREREEQRKTEEEERKRRQEEREKQRDGGD